MDFDAVVHGRHSVRDFDGEPVPEEDIRAIVEEAGLAPSWGDTQPWRVYVATGEVVNRIRAAHERANEAGRRGHSDVPTSHRTEWGEQPQRNMAAFGGQTRALAADAGLGSQEKARLRAQKQEQEETAGSNQAIRTDAPVAQGQGVAAGASAGRPAHPAPMALTNGRLFNAGTVIYLTLQKKMTEWNLLDLGAFGQTLALAAKNRGYDTMIAYELVRYPEEVRPVLGIPDDEVLVIGMAVGHASDATINSLHARRMPVDEYLTIRK
jgi:nitroreductase